MSAAKDGIERVADLNHHGHAADDLVVLGHPVERARALRLVLQLWQARRGAGIVRREQSRIVAAMGEAGFRLAGCEVPCGAAMKPSTTGALPMASAKHLIVGGKLLDLLAQARRAHPTSARSASALAGDMRSGSGNTMSKPIAAAPLRGELLARARRAPCAARAIGRPASATPRRYRRCAPAAWDRIRAG